MRRYETYKDSGVEWIGEIPVSWQLKRIKHTTYVKGRIGWKGLRSDEFLEESDSFVVTGTDFKKGKIKWETCYQIPKERYDEDPFIQLKEGDLLITKDGTIGKIAVVKDIPKMATLNSGVFVTRPKTDDYKSEYLYWVLESDVFKSFYDYNKSGSTIQHLYQNVFNEFKFTCPTLEEQVRINKYLIQKTKSLDKLISKKKQLIQLLEEELTAIINQAVTKGLNPDVSMKDSGIDWLGEIPEHWDVILFKRIIKRIKDGTHGTFVRVPKGRPFLSAKNVYNDGIKITKNESYISEESYQEIVKNGFPQKNDLLLTCVGTIGRVFVYDKEESLAFQRSVTFIRFYIKKANPKYYKIYVESDMYQNVLKSLAKTSAQSGVYMSDIMNSICILPPIGEQNKIIEFVEKKRFEIDKTISQVSKEIELLKEYKTTLISDVVTGKIDVREEVLN
ncbi:restriction endonuclease subunit S [Winogradskyella sp. MIT101101]|uniref:restriction endonuclease subunit S n=1 Tax=Winogradskyella sp. MIT101101 TaxID=3098297 RepID=UPI00399B9DFD